MIRTFPRGKCDVRASEGERDIEMGGGQRNHAWMNYRLDPGRPGGGVGVGGRPSKSVGVMTISQTAAPARGSRSMEFAPDTWSARPGSRSEGEVMSSSS